MILKVITIYIRGTTNKKERKEMTESTEELKKRIADLESELAASIQREELLLKQKRGVKSRIKGLIKRTKIWSVLSNPDSKIGYFAKTPKTSLEGIKDPALMKEIKEKSAKLSTKQGLILSPVHFFWGSDDRRRINVIMEELDPYLIKIGTDIANDSKAELRIITVNEDVNPIKYKEIIKKHKIPGANSISFYSIIGQNIRNKHFELEIAENDIIISKAWRKDE